MKIVMILIMICLSISTQACRYDSEARESELASSNAVFEGIVVGVNLDYYEEYLKSPENKILFSDTTLPHTISVLLQK